jgi:outer membrane lipoprotein-sorting protein/outer membrane protein assembly factor BamE (lipoprotein component of BamABCDE complex)
MDESEVLRRLNALADAPATDSQVALNRTRAALLAGLKPPRSFWSVRAIIRYAALVAGAAVVLLALWLAGPFGGGNLAFADVQKKVEQTKSLTMTFTQEGSDGKPQTGTAYVLSDGRLRMEDPDGGYNVVDPRRERSLAVDPAKRKALLIKGYYNRMPTDVYQILRDIRKSEVKKLPGEQLNGQTTEVFLGKLSFGEIEREAKVWVEPKSQLPIRLEIVDKDDAHAGRKMTMDLKFDQPLDEKLFSTEAPAGFTLRTEGVETAPAHRVEDAAMSAPEVKPKEGLGQVKFGMTKEQVIKELGEPDKVAQKGTKLDYLSRGYIVRVSPKRGVMMIDCYTQATFVVKVADFAGKTTEGIGMGAKSADIIKAYGKADATEQEGQMTRLSYRKLGLDFTLANDKLVQFSLSAVP